MPQSSNSGRAYSDRLESRFIRRLLALQARGVPAPTPAKPDALVGAYYFPGWSRVDRWYCIAASEATQHPLLGYYREGDPEVADWHIKWALEHGVSFFAFDFYTSGGSQMLEAALDGFLKARFIGRFKFCLNWCNHQPVETMTADELERFANLVIGKYLTHPSYLRIGGRPVVMILVGNGFVADLGVEAARKAFERFEDRCKATGLPGVYLVFCEGAIGGAQDFANAKAAGADAFCLYNYPYSGTGLTGPGKHGEATYADLTRQGESLWKQWREMTRGDFWPTVMTGWDRRPWTKDADLIRTGSTPELFGKSLAAARGYMNADRVVMIEAWNEWGEGSILEPSLEHGFAYLDQVRKVFCPGAGKHKHESPASLGLRAPVFEEKLPSTSVWRFDFDTEGWTATGITGLASEWGALVGASANADPQLTSPITYLDCAKHSKAVIRMRAMPKPGGPASATGQLFWSTTDRGLSEAASVKFNLPLDGVWREITLDLRANPDWRGRTDRFRLDPEDVEGVRFEVDSFAVEL